MKIRKKIVSTLLVANYLANQPINILAEEVKDINIKNTEQTEENKDIKLRTNSLQEVYLDGSKSVSGSGKTEEDAVNTLKEALELVSYGGVIYVTGEVVISDDVNMPDKLIYIKQQTDKDKGKLKFEKKLSLKHMLYIQDIEMEFSSNDKDCIFLNGTYLEMTNTSIIGKPNIFIGSENEDLEYGRNGFLNIINNNNLNNNTIGNINLGGKDGHTVEVASLDVKGVNIEGIVDGKNVKERSLVTITGLSMINKIDNIKKLVVYKEGELNIKEDLDTVRELYAEGEIKIKNGSKINVEHLYGTFAFDVEVPENETLIEGNYIESKIFVGDIYLSDKLIRSGYRLNKIRGAESVVVDLFNPQSNISTNYAPVIKNLREIIIREGNTVDLKKGVEGWDFEDGDITEKIVFPNIDLESLPVGKHEVSYEVTDSDGNKTIMNRIIYVIKNASPIIKGAKNITIKIGDVDNFDLLNGITVTDDKDNDLKPEVIGKIEKPSPGTNKDSTITYTVTDNDGNTTTATRVITVTNQLPVIKGLDEIVIRQGKTVNLSSGVTASDEEDGDITSSIVFPLIDISKLSVGNYEIEYSVTDSDQNTTMVKRVIQVVSNETPTLTGIENKTIQSGEAFDPLAGVEAFDSEDGNLSNIQVVGTIDPYQIGEQMITYQVTDSDGNITTAIRIITVIYRTETPSDSTISKTFVPQTKVQLNQLIEEIKKYDVQAIIVDLKEETEYYLYKIKLHPMTRTYSNASEWFIEIKVAKNIQQEVGLPGLTPEVKPEETPEVKPEETPEVKPEEAPEVKPEEAPEVKPEEAPEVKPEEAPEVKPEETPEVKPEVTPEVKPEETPEVKPEVKPENPEQPENTEISVMESEDTSVGNSNIQLSQPVTGQTNFVGYLGGAFVTLGSIFSFRKKKK